MRLPAGHFLCTFKSLNELNAAVHASLKGQAARNAVACFDSAGAKLLGIDEAEMAPAEEAGSELWLEEEEEPENIDAFVKLALAEVQGGRKHISQAMVASVVGLAVQQMRREYAATIEQPPYALRQVSFESRRMSRHGLAGRMVGVANRHDAERREEIEWCSSPRCEDGQHFVNRLLAFAVAASPVSFEHACYLLEQLWLQVPSTDNLYAFIHGPAAAAIEQHFVAQQERLLDDLNSTRVGYDMCHSAAVKAKQSLGAVSINAGAPPVPTVSRAASRLWLQLTGWLLCVGEHTGKILWQHVETDGESASREQLVFSLFMVWADLNQLDLVSVCTDDGPCRQIIREAVRKHCPTASSDEAEHFTALVIDMW